MEYQVRFPDSEEVCPSQAVLKNISLGGLYFTADTPPALEYGVTADFTFKTLPTQNFPNAREISARGIVRRVEHPIAGVPDFGVAIEFLSIPLFG
jgi:hypothetical protein